MISKGVIIRADGSKSIGMGHLKRSCILREYFKEEFGLNTLLISKKNEEARLFLAKHDMDTCWITADSMESELEELVELKKTLKYECILFIMDVLKYDTQPKYINTLKLFGEPLLSITDDSFKRASNADLVINGNPNQLGIDYKEESAKYLLGPRYFIMDSSYGESNCKFSDKTPLQVLLTLGGSDHNNLIFKVLESIKDIPDISLYIISSKGTGYLNKLSDYLLTYQIETKLISDVPTLMPYWCKVDFSITAGGNTLFERIAMRVPGVTICQLDRQNEIAEKFQSLGVNLNLGMGVSLGMDEIKSKIEFFIKSKDVRKQQFIKSPSVLDGNGLKRLGKVLKENFNF